MRKRKNEAVYGAFFVSVDNNEFELNPDTLGHYDVNFTVDTVHAIILKIPNGKEVFIQQLSKPTEIKNGATIVFGIVTGIRRQSRKGIRKPCNEENRLSKKDEFYNSLFEGGTILEQARRKEIKRIKYVEVTPRVYGCGTMKYY